MRYRPLDIGAIREISNYWAAVRGQYAAFESGMPSPSSEVYLHEMPGGQFTNLKAQARALGLEERWPEVAQAYAEVNRMFGDIVKVTPSSKVMGDMALMMVAQGLSRAQVEDPAVEVAFPDSVVDMMRGNLGQPPGGWPEALCRKVLKGEAPITTRPGLRATPVDLDETRAALAARIRGLTGEENGEVDIDDEALNGYLMYPKVFLNYRARRETYGPVRALPTRTFFYGMEPGEEITAEIDPGKTLEIQFQTVSERTGEGEVKVFFELNGQPRVIRVPDRSVQASAARHPKAEDANPAHIGAPMPGSVVSVAVSAGQAVKPGDLLVTIEAMKMETGLHAERAGAIRVVHVTPGASIETKDLLIELE